MNFNQLLNKELDQLGPEATLERRELLKLKEAALLAKRRLPHIHRFKLYTWAREFFESRERINLLCAANQLGKSSIQIRKCIEWATNKELWPFLWPDSDHLEVNQFWYLYPTSKQARIEIDTKWKQFLPGEDYKDHPQYGWRIEYQNKEPFALHFNTGVSVYFKFYAQSSEALQTGTVFAMFCDEELPVDHYNELMFRLTATQGYFHMVFTATLGQEFWRLCMEPTKNEVEKLPEAKKWTVSLWDSQFYEDGTPSPWTSDRIRSIEARCSTDAEKHKRVDGRFVMDDTMGKVYEQFDPKRHVIPKHPLPPTWNVFAGVDIGGGGEGQHKSAIVFAAVSPDMRQVRIISGWRGDYRTTESDVVQKYLELKKALGRPVVAQYYDWANPDFAKIALDMGEPFQKAEKGHERGEGIINTLFKNDLLFVYDDPELGKLVDEFCRLRKATKKKDAKDDFTDAARYAISAIPLDLTGILGQASDYKEKKEEELTPEQRDIAYRRGLIPDDEKRRFAAEQNLNQEFEEWNEAYGD
jgi:phage terminase large subunit-like protein